MAGRQGPPCGGESPKAEPDDDRSTTVDRKTMSRLITRGCALGLMVCVAAAPALAQAGRRPQPITALAAATSGELHGMIRDDQGRPLAGAVVSALGPKTAFAVSDERGRFTFRPLPPGPYLVRAHLQGYAPARDLIIQIAPGVRVTSSLALVRRADAAAPDVLTASVGGGADPAAPTTGREPDKRAARDEQADHQHDEVAWRMRHSRRSVLKEAEAQIAALDDSDNSRRETRAGVTHAIGAPARLATALFAGIPLTGQINLLTTTSFDTPQDLFSMNAALPRGVAYVALAAPGADGDWTVRGTITQGDLSSWIVAGSYTRRPGAAHESEAGLSYSAQRYLGGNPEALAAMRGGSRNVGTMYAYDNWAIGPSVRVGYGAKYASYDYLADRGLFSPRASLAVRPISRDSLTLRTSVSHREEAPGATEFLPPAIGPWLPPERTFSHLSRGEFRPQRVDHVEVSADRTWPGGVVIGVRAFSQRVEDQVATVFGLTADGSPDLGHYRVGSTGDFDARGWGVTVSRAVTDRVRASVNYTLLESQWRGGSPDAQVLGELGLLRHDERVHDVTASIESIVPPTSTRVSVLYKMNTGFAAEDDAASPLVTARFNVRVSQALPFLAFANAHWEMLVAVSNLFREEASDGSVYDELLVLRPPKRVVGGVMVRF
jgi:hypothetical protein